METINPIQVQEGKQSDALTRDGALYQRSIGDGREVCVYPRIYNSILTIGRADDLYGYETHYCYNSPVEAAQAAALWDPAQDQEPEGWFRHAASGRRRPGGDATREYINP